MTQISADRRRIEAEPDAESERLAAEIAAEYLDVRLRLARVLLRIERGRTYALTQCSSVVQYAVRLGIPTSEARTLVDLGRALEADVAVVEATASGEAPAAPGPSVEERIRSGVLHPENAAVAGRILAKPGLIQPGEDWIRKAETLRAPDLRRQVQARVEQAAQGVPEVVPVIVHVTERVRVDFRRAQSLASREAMTWLTEGQTFTYIVQHYLDAVDETRGAVGTGTRRVGPTQDSPRDRYIPAAVRREVMDRSGDRCEVPGCPHDAFLEFAHVRAHADGGSREADNLVRTCHAHHTQLDAGCLVLSEWRDDGTARRPVFRDSNGRPFDVRGTHATSQGVPHPRVPADPAQEHGAADDELPPLGEVLTRVLGELERVPDATAPPGMADLDEYDAGNDADDGSGQVAERPPPGWMSPIGGGGGDRPGDLLEEQRRTRTVEHALGEFAYT